MYSRTWITIAFLCVVFVLSVNALLIPNTPSSGQDVSREITLLKDDNRLIRQQLASYETRVETLEQDLSTSKHHSINIETILQTKIQALEKQQNILLSKRRSSAFFAYMSKSISDPPNNYTILFDHVITDVGSDYDSTHGVYRAPVNGTYHFALTATLMFSTISHHAPFFIVKNGQKLAYAIIDTKSESFEQGTITAVLHLKTNDRVYVEIPDHSGHYTIAGGIHTHFSGFLVSAD